MSSTNKANVPTNQISGALQLAAAVLVKSDPGVFDATTVELSLGEERGDAFVVC